MSEPTFTQFDAVLVDMDGTLLRLNYPDPDLMDVRHDLHDLFTEYGIDRHFSPLLGTIEKSLTELRRQADSDTVASVRERAYGRLAEEDRVAACHQSVYWRSKSLLDAIAEREIPIAVVTNNSREGAKLALAESGLPTYEVLVARDDVPKTKPNPEMITTAIARLSRTVESFVMIGDRPSDAVAAKRAVDRTDMQVFTVQVTDRPHSVDPAGESVDLQVETLDGCRRVLLTGGV